MVGNLKLKITIIPEWERLNTQDREKKTKLTKLILASGTY